jgi:glycosyltransferase involved in cell wall biosynthesis
MRALFLTHYYPPEAGAPQMRLAALTAGLTRLGWDVAVHTGFPHYPTGEIPAPYRNRPLQREIGLGGERIVRSAVYAAPNRGFTRRLADHLAFCASSLATAHATGPADVVVVETPPLFTAAAGAIYAAMKRAPLVVNVADRWPESAIELGALSQPHAIRAAEALERWIYRRAAAITVPTAGLLRDIGAERDAAGRVVRLPPAVDASRFAGLGTPEANGGPLRVLYAGTVGLAHGISTLVEAARRAGPQVVQVTVAGGGAEAAQLSNGVPENVRSLGIVPPDAVPGLYAQADAGVVLLLDRPILAGALPTKLLECLAAGRPAVLSARGEAATLISGSGAGIAVAPEDPDALAAAFRTLHGDPALRSRLGDAGREVIAAGYDRPDSIRAWADTLERVVGQRARL